MHTLQTDGHSHWFAPTPMQEALGWLVNLTMEEGTPGKGTHVSRSLQHLAHREVYSGYLRLISCLGD